MAAAARRAESALTVLVVDDEREVCDLISDILETAGFDALCVASDTEAYRVLLQIERFAAILIDIHLGRGTTGFDVARFARQRNPRVPILYISGKSGEDSFRSFGVSGSAFLQKPFAADDLVAKLLDLVDSDG